VSHGCPKPGSRTVTHHTSLCFGHQIREDDCGRALGLMGRRVRVDAQWRACKILLHQVSMIGSQIEYWTGVEDRKKKAKSWNCSGSHPSAVEVGWRAIVNSSPCLDLI
jgi:hypothetical protein